MCVYVAPSSIIILSVLLGRVGDHGGEMLLTVLVCPWLAIPAEAKCQMTVE